MAEIECVYHFDHENRLKRNESDITEIKSDLTDLKLSQAEVNTTFVTFMKSMEKNTERQTEILETMKTNQIETGHEIKDMKIDIEVIKKCQNKNEEKLESVDEKSKVDFVLLIKNNIWKVVTFLMAGYAVYMTLIK
jgi:predicted  nucleic acid-binding Zn-ribbon protein